MGHGSESCFAEWFWLRASHEVAIKTLAVAKLFEGFTGDQGFAFNMAH